jgi:hypothetical protein
MVLRVAGGLHLCLLGRFGTVGLYVILCCIFIQWPSLKRAARIGHEVYDHCGPSSVCVTLARSLHTSVQHAGV